MPITPYSMASEIVSAADAGFQNIWSLQDCIETLYEFGDEEQRKKQIIPPLSEAVKRIKEKK